MEQTLGKRIAENRKRMGLTQDQLAEKLGVTAQAVSKWENDQSCPDINTLPRLAEIFGISTDILLGCQEAAPVHRGEIVDEEAADTGESKEQSRRELKWDAGRKDSLGMAALVLLIGSLLLADQFFHWNIGFWDVAWPSGLLIFGLWGLFPKFSFVRFGCALFGGYFLLSNLHVPLFELDSGIIFPLLMVLFGLSLLADSMRKPKKNHFHITNNGEKPQTHSVCTTDGNAFDSILSFGERTDHITLPCLAEGDATVSFGELIVDLTGCEVFTPNCEIDATCSFGELHFRIPRRCKAEYDCSSHFGSVDVQGHADPNADSRIYLDCTVSFGEITIEYV